MVNKKYSLGFKLQVAEYAIINSITSASKKFGVDRKVIRNWKKTKDQLEIEIGAGRKKRKRFSGGGRKVVSDEMEQDLSTWIDENRQKGHAVSRNEIIRYAESQFPTYEDTEGKVFNASSGWLQGFMTRNHFSVRRKTTQGQQDPENLHIKIVSFIAYISRVREKYSIDPHNIIAMDETNVPFELPSATKVERTGTKTISIKTTGHEKERVTVCLAANGAGEKLKPFIVFKEKGTKRAVKQMQNDRQFSGVEIHNQSAGWMDTPLTFLWLDKVFGKSNETRLLVWDSFKPHFSPETREYFKNFNSKMAVVPGGLTKYIQAPDVSWNKPFKDYVAECYSKWMKDESNMSRTAGGNLRAPPRSKVVEWVMESWQKLDKQIIIDSFKSCALSTDVKGQEDERITCLKFGHPCRPAWDLLQKYRDGDMSVIEEMETDKNNTEEIRENLSFEVENSINNLDHLSNVNPEFQEFNQHEDDAEFFQVTDNENDENDSSFDSNVENCPLSIYDFDDEEETSDNA